MSREKEDAPLNQVPCPNCGSFVNDQAVGCPECGEKIYVNVPGDITPTRHPPYPWPGDEA